MRNEMVNHPDHYKTEGKDECIVELEKMMNADVVFDGCLFSIGKYLYRKGSKEISPEIEDVEKAIWYCKYGMSLIEQGKVRDTKRIVWLLELYSRSSDAMIEAISNAKIRELRKQI